MQRNHIKASRCNQIGHIINSAHNARQIKFIIVCVSFPSLFCAVCTKMVLS